MLSVWRCAKKHSSFFVKEQFRRMMPILLKKGKVIFPYSTEMLFCLWSHLEMVIFFFKCTKYFQNTGRGIGWSTEVTLYVTSGWNKILDSLLTIAVYSHARMQSIDYFLNARKLCFLPTRVDFMTSCHILPLHHGCWPCKASETAFRKCLHCVFCK